MQTFKSLVQSNEDASVTDKNCRGGKTDGCHGGGRFQCTKCPSHDHVVSFCKLGNGKLENEKDEKLFHFPDKQPAQQFTMSARKYIPLAIVIGFGVWNGKSDRLNAQAQELTAQQVTTRSPRV